MDYKTLARAIAQDAALRRKQVLQPVGGKGDKIFPPTYPPSDEAKRANPKAAPRHIFERRRIDGREAWCVLVDSVQSQANRLEEALLAAVRDKAIALPYVTVDFRKAQLAGITEITSLDAPHRVYDAILRDSLFDNQPFMKSDLGRKLSRGEAGRCDGAVGSVANGPAVRRVALDWRRRRPRRQVPAVSCTGFPHACHSVRAAQRPADRARGRSHRHAGPAQAPTAPLPRLPPRRSHRAPRMPGGGGHYLALLRSDVRLQAGAIALMRLSC